MNLILKGKWLGLLCASLLLLGATAVTMILIRNVDDLHSIVLENEEAINGIHASEELKSSILENNRVRFLWATTRDPIYKTALNESQSEIDHWWAIVRTVEIKDDKDKTVLASIESDLESYASEWRRLETSGLAPLQVFQSINDPLRRLNSNVDRISDIIGEEARQDQLNAKEHDELSHVVGHFSAAMIIVLIAGIIEVARRTVLKPLMTLQHCAQRFGKGDWDCRVPNVGLQELRDVGSVFNEMADNLRRQREQHIRFLASLAHDLRNPLSGIKMSAEMLISDHGDNPEDYQMLDIVRRQAVKLDRMVSDLLDVARIEAKNLVLQLEDHDISELIRDSVKLFETASTSHSFVIDLPGAALRCRCDAVRVSQVLNNLLSNAVKYSPFGGRIEIAAKTEDGFAIIAVNDRGIGIGEGDLARIFEPFRRSNAVKDTIPGVGLGLASSKSIVEAHGGRIEVESRVGVGSSFRVHLPLAKEAADAPIRLFPGEKKSYEGTAVL